MNAPVINQENIEKLFPKRIIIRNPIIRARFDFIQTFLTPVPGQVDDLLAIYAGWPFDLIAYDLACFGGTFVKQLLGIKGIAVGVFPLYEGAVNLPSV